MPSIVIMAGGTGGHVFPGVAVADELKARGWTVEWIGTADRMEAQAVPKAGYPIHFLDIKGVRGKGFLGKLAAPFMLLKAVFQAYKILKNLQPSLVLGMGGYASGPGGIAARLLSIPIVVHEQNAVFGLTNRWLAKVANRVLCGFDITKLTKLNNIPTNVEFVGNPVRQYEDRNIIEDSEQTFKILVLGGSLGALALNEIVPKALNSLADDYQISVVHQAGKGKSTPVHTAYSQKVDSTVSEFIDDVFYELTNADLIICRAGALTVAEISSVGKAAIFVPLPIAVDDHQTYNALSLTNHGAGILIPQTELEATLPSTLRSLIEDPQLLAQMAIKSKELSPQFAGKKVADICEFEVGKKYG